MAEEVTIFSKDGTVNLGILDERGRKFYHIRYIAVGGVEPEAKAREVPIADVRVESGFNYQALIDCVDRTHDLLEWQGTRQAVMQEARENAMAGVEAKIAKEIKAWEKENPRPNGTLADALPDVVEEGMLTTFDEQGQKTSQPITSVPTEETVADEEGNMASVAVLDPECPSCFRSDGSHASNCEARPTDDEPMEPDAKTEVGSLSTAAVALESGDEPDETPCPAKYAGAICVQEGGEGHDSFHVTAGGHEWSDSQSDPVAEEEEEPQESSPEGDEPPF